MSGARESETKTSSGGDIGKRTDGHGAGRVTDRNTAAAIGSRLAPGEITAAIAASPEGMDDLLHVDPLEKLTPSSACVGTPRALANATRA
jgi:hypothetical protein